MLRAVIPPGDEWTLWDRGVQPQRDEGRFMMNHADGWMGGWSGGGMWLWPVAGIAVVALLFFVIGKLNKK